MPIDPSSAMPRISLLALGFRPFFLAAGIVAILAVALWLAMLGGHLTPPAYLVGPNWHAHEMLFGYTAAVIAGFLLTAVRNWSAMPTPTGAPLAGLVALWLAARLAPWAGVPGGLAALIDIAFFPALAISLWRPLWFGPNPTNRVFVGLFAAMALACALVHLEAGGVLPGGAARGHRLMLDLVVITLLLVGGRVVPFFTESGLPGARAVTRPLVERLTFVIAGGMLAANLIQPFGAPAGVLAIALGGLQLVRLAGWHDRRGWKTPMLAVLYAGFLWLALGLALDGVTPFVALPPNKAIHALTIGAVGGITLGMMARVTVGHTGRPMQAAPLTVAAFILINLAALLRAIAPLVFPDAYPTWLLGTGLCWMLAFGLFLWVHAPMLVTPRPDGRPG